MLDYIYILENERMPGLLKIGWTSRTPEERRLEISNATGVPTSFRVLHQVKVSDGKTAERKIHSLLSSERYVSNREFFLNSHKRAISVVDFICAKYEPISNSDGLSHYYLQAKKLVAQGNNKAAVALIMQEGNLSQAESEEMVYAMSNSNDSPSGQFKDLYKGCLILFLVMVYNSIMYNERRRRTECNNRAVCNSTYQRLNRLYY